MMVFNCIIFVFIQSYYLVYIKRRVKLKKTIESIERNLSVRYKVYSITLNIVIFLIDLDMYYRPRVKCKYNMYL